MRFPLFGEPEKKTAAIEVKDPQHLEAQKTKQGGTIFFFHLQIFPIYS